MGTTNKNDAPNKLQTAPEQDGQIVQEHVRVLRSHLLWLLGSLVVAAIIGFEFKEILQDLLTMQLTDLNLMNLKAAADLPSTIVVALFAGAVVAIPVATYHTYRFVAPIVERGSSYAAMLLVGSVLLTIAAIAYVFMVTIPMGLHGMATYGQDALIQHVTTQSFLNFVVANSFVTIALFQVPLAIVFIGGVQPFSQKTRARLQLTVLPITIIGALASTPFTSVGRGIAGMALIVLPTVILFEVSMFWAKIRAKNPQLVAPVVAPARAEKPTYIPRVAPEEERLQPIAAVAAPFVMPVVAPVAVAETEQDFLTELFDDEPDFVPAAPSLMPVRPQVARTSQLVESKPSIAPAPSFVSSFDVAKSHTVSRAMSHTTSRTARPVMQPQPVTQRVVRATPMTSVITTQKAPIQMPRNPHAPQPTIPFRTSSTRVQGYSVEGLLAVSR